MPGGSVLGVPREIIAAVGVGAAAAACCQLLSGCLLLSHSVAALDEIRKMRAIMGLMGRDDGLSPRRARQQAAANSGVSGCCLQLSQEIPLSSIVGRLDHFAVDSVNQLLFLACLGANCVLVIDMFAGTVVKQLYGDRPRMLHPQVLASS